MLQPSYCRFCHNACPILVEVEDGRAIGVTGDRDSPMYEGYTCVKGRALPEQHYHPERLLTSQKRMPDGTYRPISSEQLMDEVAERLEQIVRRYGPKAVASYTGTMIVASATIRPMLGALMDAIGSPMRFDSDSLDQIGKHVAKALHGMWMAPPQGFDDPDVGLVIGANPLISYSGGLPIGNPGKWLQRWMERGYQLIVVDPRRTDLAKRAGIHLQPRPGEDVSVLAGMLRVIVSEARYDKEFVAEHVGGLEALRAVIEPFTPGYVARRADIDADALVQAARTFAGGRRGFAVASTGANMSGPGTLVEYLVLNLNTVCGRWLRAGEQLAAPFTATPGAPAKAQAMAPFPGYGLGDALPGSGLHASSGGLPTAGLPGAILHHGEDRIRGLISCAGNPVASWPDQLKTVEAMQALELLIQVDIKMSATAKLAHYVVAPKMSLETASFTAIQEAVSQYGVGYIGYAAPWAQYADAVVDPPSGSDLFEEWEFFYGLARRMGLQLEVGPISPFGLVAPVALGMETKPSTEDILAIFNRGGRIPLEEIRKHPGGALFPGSPVFVEPKDPDCRDRLDVANAQMMSDLEAISRDQADTLATSANGEPLEFRLIPRRIQQAYNSSGHSLAGMRRRHNPAFMHPDDLGSLGLQAGDMVEIISARATIVALVEPDDTLRRGLVSMTHAFGGAPETDHELRSIGSSTGRLLSVDRDLQPYTGQPHMSNVPVGVRPASSAHGGPD